MLTFTLALVIFALATTPTTTTKITKPTNTSLTMPIEGTYWMAWAYGHVYFPFQPLLYEDYYTCPPAVIGVVDVDNEFKVKGRQNITLDPNGKGVKISWVPSLTSPISFVTLTEFNLADVPRDQLCMNGTCLVK